MSEFLPEMPIRVLVAAKLPHQDGALTYRAGGAMRVGQLVAVPLGKRQVAGMVLGGEQKDTGKMRLKTAEAYAEPYILPPSMLPFMQWVAAWYMEAPGAVFKMAVSVPSALKPEKMPFADDAPTPLEVPPRREALSEAQDAAATPLAASINKGFSVAVLDGVTGSGKTEVYFEAVAAALKSGKQVLILLPEIALSKSFEARVLARFGLVPHLWHSGLGDKARRRVWRDAIRGKPMLVVGARSALFLPFANLGLVVVDEEHDLTYRQQDGVRYHARDMAVVRAKYADIPLILSSATPSLETLVNVEAGKYAHICLPMRYGGAELPQIALVDLRATPTESRRWLAPPLVEAMTETLARKEQILLFLNRRGYAPMSLCLSCRARITCPHCSAWLVTHKAVGVLRCHHCGHTTPHGETCAACGVEGMILACGPGVERLAEEVAARFPKARLGVFSSDTITTPTQASAFFDAVHQGALDMIIGTQMIAKGHHFPNLTLVGVVDADLGLGGGLGAGDLRGAELSWQLLAQVAGRAGRAARAGRVLLQTANPESRVLQSLIQGDRDGFIAAEKAERQAAAMPPYGRLGALILSARHEDALVQCAHQLAGAWPHYADILLLGPAPAPIRLLRGQHRIRFLLKTAREVNLQRAIATWLKGVKIPASIQCQVDIDPVSFF